MSLFDFFFPEIAQASHLRRIADAASMGNTQARISQSRSQQQRSSSEKRIQELEAEVAQLTIVMEALIEKLSDNSGVTREQLAAKIFEIDRRDGVVDGRVTPQQPVEEPKKGPNFQFPSS